MSSTGENSTLNLENDIERAIGLIDRLRTTSEIPEPAYTGIQSKILEIDCTGLSPTSQRTLPGTQKTPYRFMVDTAF